MTERASNKEQRQRMKNVSAGARIFSNILDFFPCETELAIHQIRRLCWLSQTPYQLSIIMKYDLSSLCVCVCVYEYLHAVKGSEKCAFTSNRFH